MEKEQLIERAKGQLDRILGFFPRVDTVSSIILGIDIGMLAFLASKAPAPHSFTWYTLLALLLPFALITKSLWHLYQSYFPRLEGGWMSLIYFREIALRKEDEFAKEFTAQTDEMYLKDLINQIYRNSEILTMKFDHLKQAFNWLALALIPWLISVFVFASKNTQNLLDK